MFLADTADFYQIFLHTRQIIRSSKLQLYIKNEKKVSIPNFFDTCYYQIDSQMLISQLCISSLCLFFSRKGTCNLSTTTWQNRISADRLRAKEPNLPFFTVQVTQFAFFHCSSHPICDQSQSSFFSRKIIFQASHFAIYRPIWQP